MGTNNTIEKDEDGKYWEVVKKPLADNLPKLEVKLAKIEAEIGLVEAKKAEAMVHHAKPFDDHQAFLEEKKTKIQAQITKDK